MHISPAFWPYFEVRLPWLRGRRWRWCGAGQALRDQEPPQGDPQRFSEIADPFTALKGFERSDVLCAERHSNHTHWTDSRLSTHRI